MKLLLIVALALFAIAVFALWAARTQHTLDKSCCPKCGGRINVVPIENEDGDVINVELRCESCGWKKSIKED